MRHLRLFWRRQQMAQHSSSQSHSIGMRSRIQMDRSEVTRGRSRLHPRLPPSLLPVSPTWIPIRLSRHGPRIRSAVCLTVPISGGSKPVSSSAVRPDRSILPGRRCDRSPSPASAPRQPHHRSSRRLITRSFTCARVSTSNGRRSQTRRTTFSKPMTNRRFPFRLT